MPYIIIPTMMTTQRKGELYALALTLIDAWFPIWMLYCVQVLGSLHSYFYSLLMASLGLTFWISRQHHWQELKNTKAYFDLGMTTLLITLLYLLTFVAVRDTTPNHVALILFLQVLFAYLFFQHKQEEHLSRQHILGVALMSCGAILILFPKNWQFNRGDLLLLIAAMLAPYANLYQKRARQRVSPSTLLWVRSTLALPFLYLLAIIMEPSPNWFNLLSVLPYLLLIGLLAFVIGKIFWIEAIYALPITKVNALYAFAPLMTMGLSYLLLNQPPTLLQLVGALPILIGSYFISLPTQPLSDQELKKVS